MMLFIPVVFKLLLCWLVHSPQSLTLSKLTGFSCRLKATQNPWGI